MSILFLHRPQRLALKPRQWCGLLVFLIGMALAPAVHAQEETETSPIVQSLDLTASVEPSCAFWLDRDWMSLGAYEGEALMSENRVNFSCSVLPSFLNGAINNFVPVCFDAGGNFQAQENLNDRLSPRTMLREGGDGNEPNDRLDYVILNQTQSLLVPDPTQSLGMGIGNQTCREANPTANNHPGILLGWNVGFRDQFDEPNTTYSLPFHIYVYGADQQPGSPVQGNYSDTITVFFVFKDT